METVLADILSGKRPIGVVGLGYVGLPLALSFAAKINVIGYDVNPSRRAALRAAHGHLKTLLLTDDPSALSAAGVIVVAVPTPVTDAKIPDCRYLSSASTTIGTILKPGTVVIFESTVYPGLTREVCGPLIEAASGLTCGTDFWLGYSPERINPGDAVHTFENVVKIVAGQDAKTLDVVAGLYETVVTAGVFRAASIEVAEAAKVVENVQRDVNIALMNDVSVALDHMGIDSHAVLAAAGTKWNFLPFTPGFVGGHCISVDPHYLAYKAETKGYRPELILAARQVNDRMGAHVAEKIILLLARQDVALRQAHVAVYGVTFKENVADIRNSRVIDMVRALRRFNVRVSIVDPHADAQAVQREYGENLTDGAALEPCDVVVLAVPHVCFTAHPLDWFLGQCRNGRQPIFVDLKRVFPRAAVEEAGGVYWGL